MLFMSSSDIINLICNVLQAIIATALLGIEIYRLRNKEYRLVAAALAPVRGEGFFVFTPPPAWPSAPPASPVPPRR